MHLNFCQPDDDPRVEKLTKEVCAHIETYLGESLDKYFN